MRRTEFRKPPIAADPAAAADTAPPPPPAWWKLALEGRAPLEWAASRLVHRWWERLPRGGGHAVLVFPGLATGDLSTLPLRDFLQRQGFEPHPWAQGPNFGPRPGVMARALGRLEALAAQHGGPISLLGWSLGGVYARELAKQRPDLVRCVVTLGTPFAGDPRGTRAWRLYELVSGHPARDPEVLARIREAPPVPTTSIYSRTDGIVAWPCSVNAPGERVENIEVHASHFGLGVNPLALYAVQDRLRQDPQQWRPFRPEGWGGWLYGRASAGA